MREWKLYDAKNRLSEVVNEALESGPQLIRRHRDEVVVLSKETFERMNGQKPDFIEYLMNGPSLEGLDLTRDRSLPREISL